jgi:hypothetical protein
MQTPSSPGDHCCVLIESRHAVTPFSLPFCRILVQFLILCCLTLLQLTLPAACFRVSSLEGQLARSDVKHGRVVHVWKQQGGLAFVAPVVHSTIQRLAVPALQDGNSTHIAIAVYSSSSRLDSSMVCYKHILLFALACMHDSMHATRYMCKGSFPESEMTFTLMSDIIDHCISC